MKLDGWVVLKNRIHFRYIWIGILTICISCRTVDNQSLQSQEQSGSEYSETQTTQYTLLASTPPMGWNSWNAFRTKISAKLIKEMADAMVSSGMKDAGYQYIIIDDGWMTKERDKDGHIIVDSDKFPNGIRPVADYVHLLGLKFGIYSSPGRYTCQHLMGSLGHEIIDARDYASWGVDYLKYDQCSFKRKENETAEQFQSRCRTGFELMKTALQKTGRPIVYSTHDNCAVSQVLNDDLPWIKNVSNMHRTSADIRDNWDRMLYCLNSTSDLWEYAGDGYWNNPDMLEVGNTTQEKHRDGVSDEKMNLEEYKTHFSMWCMVVAPLIAGNDLKKMKPEITKILTNKEMIAVDQDTLGHQGRRVKENNKEEIWMKELSNNGLAIAIMNKSERPRSIVLEWKDINIEGKRKIRDLWKHKDLGTFDSSFLSKNIPVHGVQVIKLRK